MSSVERDKGQLYQCERYLCDIDYELDYPLGFANVFTVGRLKFALQGYDPTMLLGLSDLHVVTADGVQHELQTLELTADRQLQSTVNLKK